MRRDAFDRFYSGMIFVPRDRYSTQVRNKIEALVRDRLRATHIESQVQLSESALARVHMIVRLPPDGGPRIDVDALEEQIAAAVRTWDDQLREALAARLGEIDSARETVVYCRTGKRSARAIELLAQSGFSNARLWNLEGGIDAWARDVDPAMPRY